MDHGTGTPTHMHTQNNKQPQFFLKKKKRNRDRHVETDKEEMAIWKDRQTLEWCGAEPATGQGYRPTEDDGGSQKELLVEPSEGACLSS